MNGTTQKRPGPRKPTNLPRRSTTARSHCWATFGDCMVITPSSAQTTIGIGFCVAIRPMTPTSSQPSSTKIEITLARGVEEEEVSRIPSGPGTSGSFFVRFERGQDFVEREAMAIGVRQDARREGGELSQFGL